MTGHRELWLGLSAMMLCLLAARSRVAEAEEESPGLLYGRGTDLVLLNLDDGTELVVLALSVDSTWSAEIENVVRDSAGQLYFSALIGLRSGAPGVAAGERIHYHWDVGGDRPVVLVSPATSTGFDPEFELIYVEFDRAFRLDEDGRAMIPIWAEGLGSFPVERASAYVDLSGRFTRAPTYVRPGLSGQPIDGCTEPTEGRYEVRRSSGGRQILWVDVGGSDTLLYETSDDYGLGGARSCFSDRHIVWRHEGGTSLHAYDLLFVDLDGESVSLGRFFSRRGEDFHRTNRLRWTEDLRYLYWPEHAGGRAQWTYVDSAGTTRAVETHREHTAPIYLAPGDALLEALRTHATAPAE